MLEKILPKDCCGQELQDMGPRFSCLQNIHPRLLDHHTHILSIKHIALRACRRLQDAAAWGILKAAAAEHGTSKVQWSGFSGQGSQMPAFADYHGIREDASILSHPILLPEAPDRQQNPASLAQGYSR